MKTKRIKLTHPAIKTREQMDNLVGEITSITLDERSIKTEMDDRIMNIRAEYEGRLIEIQLQYDQKMALARDWAEANPSEFGKLKSIEFTHGLLGWRTGTPKLKNLTGWTLDRVLEAIKAIPKFAKRFVRLAETVNKEAILADREILSPDELRSIGVRIIQEETFFVDPKVQDLDPRQTIAK